MLGERDSQLGLGRAALTVCRQRRDCLRDVEFFSLLSLPGVQSIVLINSFVPSDCVLILMR